MTVNLGVGIPTFTPSFLPEDVEVNFQAETGFWRVGPFPKPEEIDPDVINAGAQIVTGLDGHSFMSSADGFGMIRGGHVDVTMLGSLQVNKFGDIANWSVPNEATKGMGGAMDLVASPAKSIVMMEHTDKRGNPKLLEYCNFPLTGKYCVNMVITDLAVFTISKAGFTLEEIAEGVTLEEITAKTGSPFHVSPDLCVMRQA